MSLFSTDIDALSRRLIDTARERGLRITAAESCTGGLVAGSICAISGASDVFERGFVTYSNAAKHEMLGVPAELITAHGAVSEPVARAMAEGALAHSRADLAVAITGIAGPGGGSPQKPVGTVHFATARTAGPTLHRHEVFDAPSREAVQLAALKVALQMLGERL